jgi:hypothetical protein
MMLLRQLQSLPLCASSFQTARYRASPIQVTQSYSIAIAPDPYGIRAEKEEKANRTGRETQIQSGWEGNKQTSKQVNKNT